MTACVEMMNQQSKGFPRKRKLQHFKTYLLWDDEL